MPNFASQRWVAFSSMVRNTASRLPEDFEMTCSTSALAASRASASFGSRASLADFGSSRLGLALNSGWAGTHRRIAASLRLGAFCTAPCHRLLPEGLEFSLLPPPSRTPTTGTAGCCDRAARGHATVAPPRNVMNCRRFTRSPRRRGRAAWPARRAARFAVVLSAYIWSIAVQVRRLAFHL